MPFEIESTDLPDVKIVIPKVLPDDRGFFMEAYRADLFEAAGLPAEYRQDSHSRSRRGVIRGLHFQWEPPMSKVMRVTVGTAFLVAVDIRPGSPTVGKWVGLEASAENKKQLWAPAGFARGFCVLTDVGEIQYKCTSVYNPQGEGAVRWNDPEIGIRWPISDPILSEKDQHAPLLSEWLDSPHAHHFMYAGA